MAQPDLLHSNFQLNRLVIEPNLDAVAFGVEEGAYHHLPPGIHVTAHDKFRRVPNVLCGRNLASDYPPILHKLPIPA